MTSKARRLTATEVERAARLDRAAAARREAADRQARAAVLCVDCHGPDGYHTSECARAEA